MRHDPELRRRLSANLAAHIRQPLPAILQARGPFRPAAVAITVGPDAGGDGAFLLTRRAAGLRAHAGQWALPGGRCDPGEAPAEAARRELLEELGVASTEGDVLGLLDDYPTRSGYLITPVVVWLDSLGEMRPNPAEVAATFVVALGELEGPDTPRFLSIAESDAPVIQLAFRDTHIHAPTAAVLYQFREVAVHGRTTRVAHLEQPVFAWS